MTTATTAGESYALKGWPLPMTFQQSLSDPYPL
jgi:hypothetical protein